MSEKTLACKEIYFWIILLLFVFTSNELGSGKPFKSTYGIWLPQNFSTCTSLRPFEVKTSLRNCNSFRIK